MSAIILIWLAISFAIAGSICCGAGGHERQAGDRQWFVSLTVAGGACTAVALGLAVAAGRASL